ncbi:MAG TPA: hypothetical protein PLN69_04530 [bacterium]|nr:hypothetical protein [bacterium]
MESFNIGNDAEENKTPVESGAEKKQPAEKKKKGFLGMGGGDKKAPKEKKAREPKPKKEKAVKEKPPKKEKAKKEKVKKEKPVKEKKEKPEKVKKEKVKKEKVPKKKKSDMALEAPAAKIKPEGQGDKKKVALLIVLVLIIVVAAVSYFMNNSNPKPAVAVKPAVADKAAKKTAAKKTRPAPKKAAAPAVEETRKPKDTGVAKTPEPVKPAAEARTTESRPARPAPRTPAPAEVSTPAQKPQRPAPRTASSPAPAPKTTATTATIKTTKKKTAPRKKAEPTNFPIDSLMSEEYIEILRAKSAELRAGTTSTDDMYSIYMDDMHPQAQIEVSKVPRKYLDDFYSIDQTPDKGKNKDLLSNAPTKLKRKETEKALGDLTSTKQLYMVLIMESTDPEPLRKIGKTLELNTLSPEIKKTVSHGQEIYWLTAGHYTDKETAYNKAQIIKRMGFNANVVSEKIYY